MPHHAVCPLSEMQSTDLYMEWMVGHELGEHSEPCSVVAAHVLHFSL